MPKRDFVRIVDFSEDNGISFNLLHVLRNQSNLPDEIFSVHNNRSYIDANYFYRRYEFKRKIWNMAHDNYYALIEKYNESDIARKLVDKTKGKRKLESWQTFLSSSLFMLLDEKITRTKISEMLWEFYRATTAIIKDETREPSMKDFNSVEEYYDYFEAMQYRNNLLVA